MTTANKVTLIRMAMIPFFIYCALQGTIAMDIAAMTLFIVASCTDFIDGYIARHYNQITDFGKFVDPLADKLLVCAALVIFVQRGQMSSLMVFIILAREFIITSLRTVAMGKGRVMAAAWSGKVKTTIQIVGVVVLFLVAIFEAKNVEMPWETINSVTAWAMTLVTLYSGYDYMKRNWDIVAEGATSKK